jgi:hypothetical protein
MCVEPGPEVICLDTYINPMSNKASSPRTLDLFEYTLAIPTPLSEPTPVLAKPPALASLSDAQLAQQLGHLLGELRRRLTKGRGRRPELEWAAKQASLSFKRLVQSPTLQNKPSRSSKTSFPLQRRGARDA